VENDAEVTIEVNPDDVTEELAAALPALSVNRVSMGAQTFDDERLVFLRRRHTSRQVGEAIDRLRKAGIDNISIDLMYGFPGETLSDWKADIDAALSLDVEHLSAYCLMIEEGTELWRKVGSGRWKENSEETERAMYEFLIDRLEAAGYEHYEISNFALPGYEAKHNSAYWRHIPYSGFGPGAHSFVGGIRYAYKRDINEYIDAVTTGNESEIFSEHQRIDENEAVRERLMLGLRLASGVSDTLLASFAPLDEIYARLAPLIKSGLVIKTASGIALSAPGMYVSNSIINLIYG
jgi:oxygen-independent coproporphyrinogen-3 oxidase